MIIELLTTLARANVAAGAAILAVLILRQPARRLFGAQQAYWLWLLAPLAALAVLLPARQAPPSSPAPAPAPIVAAPLPAPSALQTPALMEVRDAGLLEVDSDRIRLTPGGRLASSEVFSRLLVTTAA